MTATKQSKRADEAVSRDERAALGMRLREAREYLGFRQDEVAKKLGIARTALSNIERGERGIDVFELKKLATIYQKPSTFFTEEKSETQHFFGTDVGHLARAVSKLSERDKEELAKFAEYLDSRSKMDAD